VSEAELHRLLSLGVIAAAVPTLTWLLRRSAPYGRHARAGWGPSVGGRAGWILMECPSVLAFAAIYARGASAASLAPVILLVVWQVHYVHRTFVFPFRLRSPPPMPVVICLTGAAFNVLNSWLNARWISALGSYEAAWLADPRFLVGVTLFAVGMAMNLHGDGVLLNLRRPGETGYRIPTGGAFRWVSCPNYLGEMMEWLGWATMTWSLAGLSFFAFTVANLLPRALAHHRWYQRTFPDYPPERRAVVPGVL
jgi:steroid 5-alpha-reductase/3-oxo-5-alpha-steroid 4-dehydrogenase 1